jgi:hypothetical protein
MCLFKVFKCKKLKINACESPKFALKSSKSTTHKGKNYVVFFWHYFVLHSAFAGKGHLATLVVVEGEGEGR